MIRERLFGYEHAFDDPLTVGFVIGIGGVLCLAALVTLLLSALGRIGAETRRDVWLRLGSWAVLALVVVVPVLLGAAWFMGAVLLLSLFCHREFARVTGSGQDRPTRAVIVFGILAMSFATFDNWYDFFVALYPLTISLIAMVALLPDDPRGYIRRVALAVLAFVLFGGALGHLAFLGNDANYRPLALFLLLAVSMNDVFAYVCGKRFGRIRFVPNTSPNKTLGGSLGALVLTTALTMLLGRVLFAGTALDHSGLLALLGLILSVSGQLGDLVMSSVKRDLGIKDVGAILPGHGGLLDRFDSLIFAAPAFFHFVGYHIGFGLDQARRIMSS